MERKSTGGAKEFSYSREELARIRATDTNSTKEFKESYRKWQEMRSQEKVEEEIFRKRQRNMLFIVIMLIAFALLLFVLRFLE
jgi:hypothetical protein